MDLSSLTTFAKDTTSQIHRRTTMGENRACKCFIEIEPNIRVNCATCKRWNYDLGRCRDEEIVVESQSPESKVDW